MLQKILQNYAFHRKILSQVDIALHNNKTFHKHRKSYGVGINMD